jgi:excisionase family DNA binding protein
MPRTHPRPELSPTTPWDEVPHACTVPQAARLLQMAEETVYALVRQGKLYSYGSERVVRIPRTELMRALQVPVTAIRIELDDDDL